MDDILAIGDYLHKRIDYIAGVIQTDPILVYGTILVVLALLLYLIDRLGKGRASWDLKKIQQMDDQEFEKLIADLWEKMDYSTEQTPPGRDEGIDVIASRPRFQGLLGTKRLAIQAKRYKADHKIDVNAVMQYASIPLWHHQFSSVVIATSSSFTDPALKAGAKMKTIDALVDGKQLIRLLNKHGVGVSTATATKVLQWGLRIAVWILIVLIGLAMAVWLYKA